MTMHQLGALHETAEPLADLTVYRWSERSLAGRSGVGPVATSLDPGRLQEWDGRLHQLVWAATGHREGNAAPRPGFMYLAWGQEAAVLRKLPVRDPAGRPGSTLTYVLTGPADWLGLPLALALCRSEWEEWLPRGARDAARPTGVAGGPGGGPAEGPRGLAVRLPRVPLDKLREHVRDFGYAVALDAARVPAGLLTALTATVLADPGAPVTVLGCPVSGEAVVYAVAGLLSELAVGPWTFATREESDSGAALPQFVFVDGQAHGPLSADRSRRPVEASAPEAPEAAGADAETVALARQLVAVYRKRGPEAFARLLPARPLATAEEIHAWMRRHQVAPGLIADVLSLLDAAAREDLDPAEAHFLSSKACVPQVELVLRGLSGARLSGLVRDWGRPDGPDLAPYGRVRDALHREVLRRCLSPAADEEAFALLPVLREARPGAEAAAAVIGEAVRNAAGRGEPLGALHVLRVVRGAGLPPYLEDQLTGGVFARLSAAQLLRQVQANSGTDPRFARQLLAQAEDGMPRLPRRRRRAARREVLDLLYERQFLADAVDRMAPEDDPAAAVPLYGALVFCAAGHAPRLAAVRALLHAADRDPGPPPALLRALYEMAGSRRARREVLRAVAYDYFLLTIPPRGNARDY